jgi:hypothetical protein
MFGKLFHVMIIPLTYTLEDDCVRWESFNKKKNPPCYLSLCGKTFHEVFGISFIEDNGAKINLVVRTKNPKRRGFIKIYLYKRQEDWIWEDLTHNKHSHCLNNFLYPTDYFISKTFPNQTKVIIWAKVLLKLDIS